jgi:hypothetical protein
MQPKNDAKESGMRKGQAMCANIKSQVTSSAAFAWTLSCTAVLTGCQL